MKVEKTVTYDKVRCLVIAAYYLGQEMGLSGYNFDSEDSQTHREKLVELITSNRKLD